MVAVAYLGCWLAVVCEVPVTDDRASLSVVRVAYTLNDA